MSTPPPEYEMFTKNKKDSRLKPNSDIKNSLLQPTETSTVSNSKILRRLRRFLCSNPTCSIEGYSNLLKQNRNYRYYLISHICQHLGDWFVRISSMLVVTRLAPNNAIALSIFTMTYMLPYVFFTSFGGMVADSYDRRKLMIFFDACSSIVTLGFVIAIQMENLPMFYVVSACRSSIAAFYEPVTKSIVPMIVTNPNDLQKAVTLHGLAWSTMLALGGFISGFVTMIIGLEACYLIDSATFILSLIVILKVKGNYKTTDDKDDVTKKITITYDQHTVLRKKTRACLSTTTFPVRRFAQMSRELFQYLYYCGFGILVLLKASGSLSWGVTDIMNMSFALIKDDETRTSERLGFLYSCSGIGSFCAPFLASMMIDMKRLATLQLCVISAFSLLLISWLGISNAPTFQWICFFTFVKSIGISIIWIYSSLILQTLTDVKFAGRVLALEHQVTVACDVLASFLAGYFEDKGISNHQIAACAALVAGASCSIWSIFHTYGGGAANRRFNAERNNPQQGEISSNETHLSIIDTESILL